MLRYNKSRIDIIYERWLKNKLAKEKKDQRPRLTVNTTEESWDFCHEKDPGDLRIRGKEQLKVADNKKKLDN